MRRIILALCAVTLTACAGPDTDRIDGRASADATAEAAADAAAQADADAAGNAADTPAARSNATDRRNILFVGTSLTAGYGVGEAVAYPAVIQDTIDTERLPFRVVNAGISGETSAGGLRRIDWSLQQPVDVLVLELGANDGLRGLDPRAMQDNIDEIISRTRERYPDAAVVLVGMEAPPNLGSSYTNSYRDVFTTLARRHDAALVPFLLEGVAGEPALNIDDGIHPNPAGHRILARTVWSVLEPVLRQRIVMPAR